MKITPQELKDLGSAIDVLKKLKVIKSFGIVVDDYPDGITKITVQIKSINDNISEIEYTLIK